MPDQTPHPARLLLGTCLILASVAGAVGFIVRGSLSVSSWPRECGDAFAKLSSQVIAYQNVNFASFALSCLEAYQSPIGRWILITRS